MSARTGAHQPRWRPTGHSLAVTVALAGVGLAAVLLFLSFGNASAGPELRAWALVVFAIALFATHVLPEHVTALAVMFLAIVGGIGPTSVVFSGFEVGALWLLLSGIILGQAVQEAGLGVYLARRVLSRWQLTYPRAILLLVIVACLLGFVVPATIPRIILLMPIALGMADAMGLKVGGRGYTGLALAVGLGTLLPTFAIITANLPTVVHVGAIESVHGIVVSYGEFLIYHFPFTGLFRGVVLTGLLIIMFREPVTPLRETSGEPMTPTQKRLLVVLLAALFFWCTDIIHGIQPAWVAMAAAIIVLWPSAKLISPTVFKDKLNFAPVLYIGALLGVGALMIHNGLDDRVGDFALRFLRSGGIGGFIDFYLLSVLSMGVCLITTAPAAPAILVPIAGDIAQATGLPLLGVLMAELSGFTTTLLPYQAPPLIVMLGLCDVRVLDVARVCVSLAVAMLIVGFPVIYLWWRAIGLL